MLDRVRDHWNLAALFAGVIVAAVLVNAAKRGRRTLRRTVILLLFTFVLEALAAGALAGGAHVWAARFTLAAHLFEGLVAVNLVAIFVFDLAMRVVSISLPDIAADLTIGAGYVAVAFAVIHEGGGSASSVLGASAVVSAILALSLQSTLGNVIGGVALQLDGSFQEGDWLQLENGRQGLVKRIRWRHTVIETRDWGTLIVPNSMLLGQQILVMGKRAGQPRRQHRYWVYFNVDFRFPPTRVIDIVNEALQAAPIPNVALEPKPHCICFDFASHGRDSFGYYAVRYWLTDLAYDDPTNSVVRGRIYGALKRASIPLAMPAQTTFFALGGEEEEQRRVERHRTRRGHALHSVKLFAALTDKEIDSLVDHLRYAPFTRGETITKQGNVAHWLYVVCSGTVEVRLRGDGAASKDVATIDAPGYFGEMGLMTGEPRQADVIAVTDVDCYRLDKEAFNLVLQARPEIAADLSRTLAERRVELWAVRENLSEAQKQSRKAKEQERILQRIREFFALDETRASKLP
ncbi:MAG TPA: mechanosensitive ion channel family protein [Polyangiaceae bacterium]|jgi:small-conductance mechanosensitive channel/CRP-like cAMP-binding protein